MKIFFRLNEYFQYLYCSNHFLGNPKKKVIK